MKALLFDMDGVLYNGERPIPGAPEAIQWVRSQGIPYLFVTNTSSRGRDALVEKLEGFGIPATKEEILTPPRAAADWLREHGRGPAALFVREKTLPEFEGIPRSDLEPRYVVVGDLGEEWDFHTLNRAFRLLHGNPEATLIALGQTRFWQATDGPRLDVAPFVAALECATRKKALVFGKPAAPFFQAAAEKLGVSASEILMLGDDIEVDMAGAQQAGLKGGLVRTGKFRPSDLERGFTPDLLLDSIADLPGCF